MRMGTPIIMAALLTADRRSLQEPEPDMEPVELVHVPHVPALTYAPHDGSPKRQRPANSKTNPGRRRRARAKGAKPRRSS